MSIKQQVQNILDKARNRASGTLEQMASLTNRENAHIMGVHYGLLQQEQSSQNDEVDTWVQEMATLLQNTHMSVEEANRFLHEMSEDIPPDEKHARFAAFFGTDEEDNS